MQEVNCIGFHLKDALLSYFAVKINKSVCRIFLRQKDRRIVLDWLISHPAERNRVMDSIVQLVEESQRADGAKKGAVTKQNWVTIEQAGMSFAGRFVPDTEHDANTYLRGLSEGAKTNYEEWLRETTTLSVNTEVRRC